MKGASVAGADTGVYGYSPRSSRQLKKGGVGLTGHVIDLSSSSPSEI